LSIYEGVRISTSTAVLYI